jgi:hypothetical protein
MFKAETVAGVTRAQSIAQDTQNDVSMEDTTYHKERNTTTRSA